MPPVWFRHDAVLAHDIPGHPERPQRIRALEARMAEDGWHGFERRDAPVATREQLLRVHPEAHIAAIESLCAIGGGQIDMDTACVPASWEAALRAAGGAVALVDALLSGDAPSGVSALRPPGHHAEAARAMGFCLFNSVAVAARHATAAYGVERVLILDWDVHHGNGTNAIFHADADVLFASIHEWPLYPGTGPAGDVGFGEGEGYTVNLPVPGGAGDDLWVSLVEAVVAPLIREWAPGLVLVSAGFDAHRADPLASCRVTEDGYARMAASVVDAATAVGAPVGLVLEGGYDLGALAGSMAAVAPVLAGGAGGRAGVGAAAPPFRGEPHPLAAEAAARLSRWWPALAPAPGAA